MYDIQLWGSKTCLENLKVNTMEPWRKRRELSTSCWISIHSNNLDETFNLTMPLLLRITRLLPHVYCRIRKVLFQRNGRTPLLGEILKILKVRANSPSVHDLSIPNGISSSSDAQLYFTGVDAWSMECSQIAKVLIEMEFMIWYA